MKLTVLGVMLLSLEICTAVAAAQERVPADAPPPQTPPAAASQPEEASPPRKWPPFGLAVGIAIRDVVPVGDSTSELHRPAPLVRFVPRNARSGWVPAFRFGFSKQQTTLVRSTVAGQGQSQGQTQPQIGSVSIRPFAFGAGWAQPVANRLSMVFSGTIGYSWNSTDASDNGHGSPQLLVPASVVDIGNSFVWDASARAWFDVTSRVSVMAGLSYLQTTPTLTSSDGTTRPWNANQIKIDVGIAFTVLKPIHARAKRR